MLELNEIVGHLVGVRSGGYQEEKLSYNLIGKKKKKKDIKLFYFVFLY